MELKNKEKDEKSKAETAAPVDRFRHRLSQHKFRSSYCVGGEGGYTLVAFNGAVGFYANVNDTLSASLKTFLSRRFSYVTSGYFEGNSGHLLYLYL